MIRFGKRTPEYERLEYEPLTVLEILTEMKDLSELVTSLAYSAILLQNDPIAEEVDELARRMDWLKYQLRLQAALSVRTTEEAEEVAGILQVGDASEHIANACTELVELLDAKVQGRAFLQQALEEADDHISTVTVPADAQGLDVSFGELQLESNTGLRVLAIRRGKNWVYDPGKHNHCEAGDVLLMRGQSEGVAHFKAWLDHKEADL